MDLDRGFHDEIIEAKENRKQNSLDIKQNVNTLPLFKGGANFKTHILIKKSDLKFIYKPTVFTTLFCFIFIFIGLGLLLWSLSPFLFEDSERLNNIQWIPIGIGVLFSIGGFCLYYYLSMPRVFDKHLGFYYKSYTKRKRDINKCISIDSIIALQIIGEHVTSSDNPYKSFELNLVLEDATRKNVVDHGNLKSIIKDAQTLSEFLNIPIWHATSHLDKD